MAKLFLILFGFILTSQQALAAVQDERIILFVGTDNVFRSVSAEVYTNYLLQRDHASHRAQEGKWVAKSRGLTLSNGNDLRVSGPAGEATAGFFRLTADWLRSLSVPMLRKGHVPTSLTLEDIEGASRIILLRRSEHEALYEELIKRTLNQAELSAMDRSKWFNKVEYWDVGNADSRFASEQDQLNETLKKIQTQVEMFIQEIHEQGLIRNARIFQDRDLLYFQTSEGAWPLKLRPAHEMDLESLVELNWKNFPHDNLSEARARRYVHSTWKSTISTPFTAQYYVFTYVNPRTKRESLPFAYLYIHLISGYSGPVEIKQMAVKPFFRKSKAQFAFHLPLLGYAHFERDVLHPVGRKIESILSTSGSSNLGSPRYLQKRYEWFGIRPVGRMPSPYSPKEFHNQYGEDEVITMNSRFNEFVESKKDQFPYSFFFLDVSPSVSSILPSRL